MPRSLVSRQNNIQKRYKSCQVFDIQLSSDNLSYAGNSLYAIIHGIKTNALPLAHFSTDCTGRFTLGKSHGPVFIAGSAKQSLIYTHNKTI